MTTLGIGEAVVTVQSEKGTPTPVAATMIRAPLSLMAPTPLDQLEQILRSSPLYGKYATAVDRVSARELLAAKFGSAGWCTADSWAGTNTPAAAARARTVCLTARAAYAAGGAGVIRT